MNEKKEDIISEIPKPRVTTLVDVLYPRKFWDDIRKGNPIDFHELVRTGMALAFVTPFEDEMESIKNSVIAWGARNKNTFLALDMDAEQKLLDRFLELNKNNGRIDYTGLYELFEKVCLYSSILSEHQDDEHPTLISLKTRVITFESGKMHSHFIAISSHPDLIEDSRLEQMMNIVGQKLEKWSKELKSKKKTSEISVVEQPHIYNINIIGHMINSNIQQGTTDSIQNQTIQQNDLNAINDLISKLEKSLDKLLISDKQKQDLIANIQTMKAQTTTSKPARQIVADILNSIKDILQTLPAGQTIVTEIISNGNHILKALGIN